MQTAIPAFVLDRLRDALGVHGIIENPSDVAPYLRDWRNLRQGASPFVLRPGSLEEVAGIVKILADANVSVVPQGGNTSLVAGAIPDASGTQIVVSLARMNRIRMIDPIDRTMIVEAGVTLKAVQDAASEQNCLFPLSIASEGSATIGGALATNAGGNTTIRYGNARDLVLGVEAVLPDGRVWRGLRRLHKDNTGYALRHLFVGSEGTLGIITAASLRLFPAPVERAVAFCALRDEEAALALFRAFDALDGRLRAFEYMSGESIRLVAEYIPNIEIPFKLSASHYVLVDLSSSDPAAALRDRAEAVLVKALEAGGVVDAVVAASSVQEAALWRIREEHSEAQNKAGSSIKNDVSVPVSSVPEFLRTARLACEAILPGVRIVPFGHMGDGNIHFNLVQPEDGKQEFLACADALVEAVNSTIRQFDGSFSAEHGIGFMKPDMLYAWRAGVEYELYNSLKSAIDPAYRLNPGKMLHVPKDANL